VGEAVEGVIDFHVHLPWRYRDPVEAARRLVARMDEAGVSRAVVIAVELGVDYFRGYATPRRVRRALEDAMDLVAFSRVPMVSRLVYDVEGAVEEHARLIKEHFRPSEHVIRAAEAYPRRLLPVASYCPGRGARRILDLYRAHGDKIFGVKIYPTLHQVKPSDRRLDRVIREVARHRGVVIVHTGCDPGVWELPGLCSLARPRYVAEAAKRHRDAVFIIAHMGSYSALQPGIFFREALEASSLDNVYLDTSAVDTFFVERAVEEVGYEKLLFGSDYPYVVGLTIKDAVQGILRLGIPWEAKRAILRENAERLLRLLGRI